MPDPATKAKVIAQSGERKAAHASVGYGPGHIHADHCAVCRHYVFDGPHCRRVVDPIRPQDWCRLFARDR